MIYVFGAHRLDSARQALTRDGVSIEIEPMALELLLLLVSNSERLVSKEELFGTLWGGRAVSEASLSTCVKSARRAVGDDGHRQSVIKTVHGKGYRWVASFAALDEPARASAGAIDEGSDVTLVASGRPSVAVLPFVALGAEAASLSLGEAIPHELIAAISRLRWISVIARGSSFRFTSDHADLAAIGRSLGVRYCLTGSVEADGPRVAVTVELADTFDQNVIWADRFQSPIEGVHEVREQIVAQVTLAVEIQIPLSEAGRARLRSPESIDVWSTYHLGLQHLYRFDVSENDRAIAMFEKAISGEPGFARAHAALSFAHFKTAFMHYSSDREHAADAARRTAERAVELDPMDPLANFSMGRSLWLVGDLGGALVWLNRSTSLSPSFAQGIYARAWTETVSGFSADGRRLSDEARALSPLDPMLYAMLATRAYSLAIERRDEEAASWANRAANSPGAHHFIWLTALVASELAGKTELAALWAQRIKQRRGDLSQAQFFRSFPFSDQATRARFSEAMARHEIN